MTDMTIRELFEGLSRDPVAHDTFSADPDGYLTSHGFDLPSTLVGEAIVNVAATLPVELAERLAPFTTAYSPIDLDSSIDSESIDPLEGLALLAATPVSAVETVEFGRGVGDASASTTNRLEGAAEIEPIDAAEALDGPPSSLDGPIDSFDADLTDLDLELESPEQSASEPGFEESGDPAVFDDLDGVE